MTATALWTLLAGFIFGQAFALGVAILARVLDDHGRM